MSDSTAMILAKDVVLGSFSGILAKTTVAPFERVKIILQTQDANRLIRSGQVQRYTGVLNCLSRIYKEQGLKSFWRGNFTNCFRYFPATFYRLSFNDYGIRTMFPKYSKKREFGMYFLASLATGTIISTGSLLWTYPFELAQTRLAADVGIGSKSFKSFTDVFMSTIRSPVGFKGIYSGFSMAIIRIVPYQGMFLGGNQSFARLNPYRHDHSAVGLISKFLVAQSVTVMASYACYPMDTVCKRMQMQALSPQTERIYTGVYDCCRTIISQEGVTGFFNGAGVNLFRATSSALVVVLYGELSEFYKDN